LYGDEIEIDTTFRTNDLGLVDHRDYLPQMAADRSYAFLGDSYAAGVEGGRPWIPALRDRLGLKVYALGMGATGVLGFERMLESISRQLTFTDVVFVAISDDFYRPLWRPLVRDGGLWICADAETDEGCVRRLPIAHFMEPNDSKADLVARAHEIHAARTRARGVVRSWLRSSRLLTLARDFVAASVRGASRGTVVDESVAAIERVRRAHPEARIRFVHVPDKYETGRGEYGLALAPLLEGKGVEYLPVLGACPWSTQIYYANDNHPDAAGYQVLAACVARLLDWEPAPGGR
jgi:lysophospholipase L1-like esterase